MSHQDTRDIERIFKTFKRLGKQIFKEDVDALKRLNESLEFYKIEQVNDNRIYAKLLALHLKTKYCGNIDLTLKFLGQDLSQPLYFHLDNLQNKIRCTELIEYVKTLKIDVPENEFNDIEALTKKENEFWTVHQKAIIKQINDQYGVDFVKNNFYNTANEILRNIDFSA